MDYLSVRVPRPNWPQASSVLNAALGGMVLSVVQSLWDGLVDAWSIFRVLFRMVWYLLRWPIILFLVLWMCLQALAIGYTVTSTVFLSNFCEYKLPIIRNWVCSSWDQRQTIGLQELSGPTANLNHPFESVIKSSNTELSFRLPYYLVDSR